MVELRGDAAASLTQLFSCSSIRSLHQIAVAMAGGIAGITSGVAEAHDETVSDDCRVVTIAPDAYPVPGEDRSTDTFRAAL